MDCNECRSLQLHPIDQSNQNQSLINYCVTKSTAKSKCVNKLLYENKLIIFLPSVLVAILHEFLTPCLVYQMKANESNWDAHCADRWNVATRPNSEKRLRQCSLKCPYTKCSAFPASANEGKLFCEWSHETINLKKCWFLNVHYCFPPKFSIILSSRLRWTKLVASPIASGIVSNRFPVKFNVFNVLLGAWKRCSGNVFSSIALISNVVNCLIFDMALAELWSITLNGLCDRINVSKLIKWANISGSSVCKSLLLKSRYFKLFSGSQVVPE